MESYIVISTQPEDRKSELGVMKVVDGVPSMHHDKGNRVTFRKQSGIDRFLVTADMGGETVELGELVFSCEGLEFRSPQDFNLYFRQISPENAQTYALEQALGEIFDELYSRPPKR